MPALDNGTRVWLTGASSGIGLELAKALAGRGCHVIASGRNQSALDALCLAHSSLAHSGESAGKITPLAVDVGDIDAVRGACAEIDSLIGALDCVILNAGICEYVDTKQFDVDLIARVMHVNFMGTVHCIEGALPLLRKGNAPYLVGMSSTAAYAGLPRAEAYGASKAAVRYLFQSLDIDLAAEGMDVSVILPGFVETPLTEKNDFPMPGRIPVDKAVDAILRGLDRRTREISFPFIFQLVLRLLARLPDGVRTRLYRRMVA